MPKLWNETIEAHLAAVREAILDAAAAIAAKHGPRAVTMSLIAADAGIGRATLYKYFANVEAVLFAWHERHVATHLAHLRKLKDEPGDAIAKLEAVLGAYALILHSRERHGVQLSALLHKGAHIGRAEKQLTNIVAALVEEAQTSKAVRNDISPDELALYCVHALSAASALPSRAALNRLVAATMSGLRKL